MPIQRSFHVASIQENQMGDMLKYFEGLKSTIQIK